MEKPKPKSDVIVKRVGKRAPPQPLSAVHSKKDHARAWRKALPTPFIPKGVYRFSSHEEANEWMWKMITRRRAS